jgi:hypothetical protein
VVVTTEEDPRKEQAMSTQDVTTRTRRVDSERGALLLILAMVGLMLVALFAMGA